jgi:threonine/homoserine/homoserine lactone efflux protein
MNLTDWFVYLSVVLLSTASPGPAVLLSVTNAVRYGWRSSVYSSLGNIAGLTVLCALSILGISTLFSFSAELFLVLKIMGACYLMYLGYKQWTSASAEVHVPSQLVTPQSFDRRQLFIQGLGVALTNPKALLFFGALFPQFINNELPFTPQILVMLVTVLIVSFFALMSYGFLASYFPSKFKLRTSGVGVFRKFSGVIFVSLGVALLGVNFK